MQESNVCMLSIDVAIIALTTQHVFKNRMFFNVFFFFNLKSVQYIDDHPVKD